MGAFIGPTVAGILFDNIGFPWGTLFVIGVHLVVLGLLMVVYIDMKLNSSLPEIQVTEEEPLMRPPSETYGAIGGRDAEPGSSGLRYTPNTQFSEILDLMNKLQLPFSYIYSLTRVNLVNRLDLQNGLTTMFTKSSFGSAVCLNFFFEIFRPSVRPPRVRKYSEAVSGSVAKSISMVYPQFIATSYM